MATSIYSGDSFTVPVTVQESGVDVDSLAGATVKLAIIDAAGVAVVEKTTSDASVDGAVATFTITAADTADLEGTYTLEVEVTDAAGVKRSTQITLHVERDYIT